VEPLVDEERGYQTTENKRDQLAILMDDIIIYF
jgi:hypothetical protein